MNLLLDIVLQNVRPVSASLPGYRQLSIGKSNRGGLDRTLSQCPTGAWMGAGSWGVDSCCARQLPTCRLIGSKFRCIRSTPIDRLSSSSAATRRDLTCTPREHLGNRSRVKCHSETAPAAQKGSCRQKTAFREITRFRLAQAFGIRIAHRLVCSLREPASRSGLYGRLNGCGPSARCFSESSSSLLCYWPPIGRLPRRLLPKRWKQRPAGRFRSALSPRHTFLRVVSPRASAFSATSTLPTRRSLPSRNWSYRAASLGCSLLPSGFPPCASWVCAW
jgi:hypothetical protein